jgi:hypothetical protein
VTAYRHPLAFLLGLEGAALLRSSAGDGFDRELVDARIAAPAAIIWHFEHAPADPVR